MRRGNCIRIEQRENFLFDCQLARIRQLVAIAGENLDAVIGPGIVRCRNHHPRVEALRSRQESDAWCRDHARAAGFYTHRLQALQKPVGDPRAGDTCVLSNHDARFRIDANEIMAKSATKPINTFAR